MKGPVTVGVGWGGVGSSELSSPFPWGLASGGPFLQALSPAVKDLFPLPPLAC